MSHETLIAKLRASQHDPRAARVAVAQILEWALGLPEDPQERSLDEELDLQHVDSVLWDEFGVQLGGDPHRRYQEASARVAQIGSSVGETYHGLCPTQAWEALAIRHLWARRGMAAEYGPVDGPSTWRRAVKYATQYWGPPQYGEVWRWWYDEEGVVLHATGDGQTHVPPDWARQRTVWKAREPGALCFWPVLEVICSYGALAQVQVASGLLGTLSAMSQGDVSLDQEQKVIWRLAPLVWSEVNGRGWLSAQIHPQGDSAAETGHWRMVTGSDPQRALLVQVLRRLAHARHVAGSHMAWLEEMAQPGALRRWMGQEGLAYRPRVWFW